MDVMRFFFGSGWWVLWYLAVYAIFAVGAAMPLAAFGGELKKPGEPPDLPSLGSMLFVMIPVSIGTVTLVNALLASPAAADGILARVGLAVVATAIVAALTGRLGWWLASSQTHTAFRVNVAVAAVALLANLALLHVARHPSAPPPLPPAPQALPTPGADT